MKKNNYSLLFRLLAVFTFSCFLTSCNTKVDPNLLIGCWKVENKHVTSTNGSSKDEDDEHPNQYFEFKSDGSASSVSASYGSTEGPWSIHGDTLFFDNDFSIIKTLSHDRMVLVNEYDILDCHFVNESELVPVFSIPYSFNNDDDIFDDDSNDTSDENDSDKPVFICEDMPEFPGGDEALKKYIADNIIYPEQAKKANIQGTVFMRYIVDENGNVSNVEVLRGVDPLLDNEAIRVVKSIPTWKPGMQSGKPIKVQMSVPVKFVL